MAKAARGRRADSIAAGAAVGPPGATRLAYERLTSGTADRLFLSMLLCVGFGGLFGVVPGVMGVPCRAVGMMCGLLMLPTLVVLGGFGVVLSRTRMVLGRLFMMLSCFLRHIIFLV